MNDLDIIEIKNKLYKTFLKLEAWAILAKSEKGREELLECARDVSKGVSCIEELDRIVTFKRIKDE